MIQTEKDISLLIIIPFTYPKIEPEIYCLTEFCHPHICDGRNLLFDIIKKPWQKKVHNLDFVINKLYGFFLSFNESRISNKNLIVGRFELNKLYSINRLKELPIYFHLITHKEKKNTFKSVKTPKIITISEISFCMYELDNNHTGFCKLIFYADLKDLISTNLDNKKTEIEIKWKNALNDKKNIKIEIISPNFENINKILLQNQKAFLEYNNENENININKNKEKKENFSNKQAINNLGLDINNNINKEEYISENKGELNQNIPPPSNINISMVEKQIIYVEKSINVAIKPNKEQINYLMKLYQSAISYYTSVSMDEEKYKVIKNKLEKLQNNLHIKDNHPHIPEQLKVIKENKEK